MAAADSHEFDYTPGYVKPTHTYGDTYGDEFHAPAVQELLLSHKDYTQRGVTLAAGQGVLPTGTILGRQTATGLYFPYNAAATDGTQTPLGVLRDARDTGGPSSPALKPPSTALGNMVIRGTLNANLVSGTDTDSLIAGPRGVAQPTLTALGARVASYGGGTGTPPFPGSPMDGQTVGADGTVNASGTNAFIF